MFSLAYLLIPYGFFLVLGLLFLFFNLFHLGRYGIDSLGTEALMLFDVALFAGLIVGSLALFSTVDWSMTVNIVDMFPAFHSLNVQR